MIDDALKILIPGYGIASSLAEQFTKSNKNSQEILDTNDDEKIKLELKRKKFETEILEMEAKVAQELAISRRIENAAVVEIEEYYEGSGKGNAGLNAQKGSVDIGLSGEGKKITKRIYRFSGYEEKK